MPASAVALAFCSWSFYTFIDISSIEYIMAKKNLTEKEKLGLIADTKFAYGQSRYQELYLFSTMPLSNDNLADRLDMGRRVTSSFASEELFVKQAVLLALNKEKDESLFMFNAACKINDGVDCNNVKSTVKELIQNYPARNQKKFLHLPHFQKNQNLPHSAHCRTQKAAFQKEFHLPQIRLSAKCSGTRNILSEWRQMTY